MIECEPYVGGKIAVLVVAIAWFWVKNFGNVCSKDELCNSTESSFRLDWINTMRGYFVDLFVRCKTIKDSEYIDKDTEMSYLNRCLARISMKLNPTSESFKKIKDLLSKLDFDKIGENADTIVKDIEEIGAILFMEEMKLVMDETEEMNKKCEKGVSVVKENKNDTGSIQSTNVKKTPKMARSKTNKHS